MPKRSVKSPSFCTDTSLSVLDAFFTTTCGTQTDWVGRGARAAETGSVRVHCADGHCNQLLQVVYLPQTNETNLHVPNPGTAVSIALGTIFIFNLC